MSRATDALKLSSAETQAKVSTSRKWGGSSTLWGLLALLLALAALKWAEPSWMRALRHLGEDALQGAATRDAASELAIVHIGEPSLLRTGPWPWPRDRLAALLDDLRAAGASAVALNIILDAPDRFSPRRFNELGEELPLALRRRFASLPDTDEHLAQAMARLPTALASSVGAGRILAPDAAYFALHADGPPPAAPLRFDAATLPTPTLELGAAAVGAANLRFSGDMVARRAPLALFGPRDGAHPALAVALLAAQGRDVRVGANMAGEMTLTIDGRVLPAETSGEIVLDFSRLAAMPVLEAQALSGEADPRLAGRMVVVGLDIEGVSARMRGADGALVSGAETAALVADALLSGDLLHRPGWAGALELAALLLGGGLIALGWSRASLWPALIAPITVAALWVAIVWGARVWGALVLDLAQMLTLWLILASLGAVLRVVSLFRARERLMRRLAQRMATAEEAESAKSDFLAGISHDLRGPLNAIIGFSELMKRMNDDGANMPRVRDYADAVGKAGGHMLTLANRAVRAAEMGAAAATPELQEIDLRDTLLDARRLALAGGRDPDGSATISVPAGPPLRLNVDRTYFMEAVLNLLDNAVAYGAGAEGVRLAWGRTQTGGAHIDVMDSGPGLSAELLAAAGTRFLSKKMGRRGKGGFGLGIHLAKHAMELHGGRLELRNRPEGGLHARMTLPQRAVVDG